ncbi:MAG: response regulator transcription factor [Bdellovibrio sp.]
MSMVATMTSSNIYTKTIPRIVIVDDYEDSCKLLADVLSSAYECFYTADANSALNLIEEKKPDLIILDYKMPGMTGIDLCRKIRQSRFSKNTPVIFISGTATVDEKIQAFETGADDFVSKPFNTRELILRIKARLGKNQSAVTELVAANLHMKLSSRQVFIDDEEINLTPKQFDILRLLLESKNNLVTREKCLDEIWGDSGVTARNVDSQINYLKRKIEKFSGRIVAVTSLGYRLEV